MNNDNNDNNGNNDNHDNNDDNKNDNTTTTTTNNNNYDNDNNEIHNNTHYNKLFRRGEIHPRGDPPEDQPREDRRKEILVLSVGVRCYISCVSKRFVVIYNRNGRD